MTNKLTQHALTSVAILLASTGTQSHVLRAQETNLQGQVDEIFVDRDSPDSPGCAVSVMEDGAIVYKRGYGMANLEYGVPITPSSIFHVASVSKQFTVFAVLLLAEEGKLSLDDDVREYVEEVPDFGTTLTIRQLIHHTSGLRDQWSLLRLAGWRFEADVITQGDVLDITSRQTSLNFNPGDEYLYSNTGYTLLGVIVERISGQSLRDFTEERIFEPLGMDDTHFHDDHRMIVKNRAYAYGPTGGDDTLKIRIPDFDVVGATSLFTTVEDLARWDRNFYTARVGGRRVIDQMHTRGVLNSGQEIPYAYALVHGEYRGLRTVGHGGADAGYRSSFLRFPGQRFSVAVLCNFPSSNPGRKAQEVADVYLAGAFTEPAETELDADEAPEVPESDMNRFAGAYRRGLTDVVVVLRMADDKLIIGPTIEDGQVLTALGEGRFRVGTSDNVLSIESSESTGSPRLQPDNPAGDESYDWAPLAQPTADELAAYVGRYYSDELVREVEFVIRDGKLILKARKSDDVPLQPTFKDGFVFATGPGAYFTFLRNEHGDIAGFTISTQRVRKVSYDKIGQ